MSKKTCSENPLSKAACSEVSRRTFFAISAAGVAAATAGCALRAKVPDNSTSRSTTSSPKTFSYTAPFDTFRDYIKALEERGLVLRFEKLDQDAYEMTALMYLLIDQYGWCEAPAILAEQVKINGEWIKGPLIANHQGHLDTEAILFGVEPVPHNTRATYRKAMA